MPAFKRITNPTHSPVANLFGKTAVDHDKNCAAPDDDLAGQIINYIEGIRLQSSGKPTVDGRVRQGDVTDGGSVKEQDEFDKQVSDARRKGDKLVLDAEQFRATINAPAGMALVNYQSTPLDIDDQFFHITCHIDEGTRQHIERGAYVNLEKLLPKPKGCPGTNENKMELIYKDGHSYFVPAPQEGKINGVRRWEQAFWVYMTLYSQANPARSAEIWQYVHTINMAAASYQWNNVANYDFTFRQLMGKFPQRSWAKIYNQMWWLSMKDPVQKGAFQSNNQFRQNHKQGGGSTAGNVSNASNSSGDPQ